jgi:Uncharacterized conserved protein
MPVYNKLVRDKIPEIIENAGKIPHTRILDNDEYITELDRKLDEECAEFHKDKNVEELADIMEVVYALARAVGSSPDELESVRKDKANKRGGFEKKIFLERVDD